MFELGALSGEGNTSHPSLTQSLSRPPHCGVAQSVSSHKRTGRCSVPPQSSLVLCNPSHMCIPTHHKIVPRNVHDSIYKPMMAHAYTFFSPFPRILWVFNHRQLWLLLRNDKTIYNFRLVVEIFLLLFFNRLPSDFLNDRAGKPLNTVSPELLKIKGYFGIFIIGLKGNHHCRCLD